MSSALGLGASFNCLPSCLLSVALQLDKLQQTPTWKSKHIYPSRALVALAPNSSRFGSTTPKTVTMQPGILLRLRIHESSISSQMLGQTLAAMARGDPDSQALSVLYGLARPEAVLRSWAISLQSRLCISFG